MMMADSIFFEAGLELLKVCKGVGSYSGQGGRIARTGHPGRRKRIAGSRGKSRAAGANRGQRGQIVQKRHFAMFCCYNSLLILAQSKH